MPGAEAQQGECLPAFQQTRHDSACTLGRGCAPQQLHRAPCQSHSGAHAGEPRGLGAALGTVGPASLACCAAHQLAPRLPEHGAHREGLENAQGQRAAAPHAHSPGSPRAPTEG